MNKFTHELTCYASLIFDDCVNFQQLIANHFDDVENVKLIRSQTQNNKILVTGNLHLYGYLVQDGGFFDLINQKYYDENSMLLKNAKITESNSNTRKLS